jgi:hypothetical protein
MARLDNGPLFDNSSLPGNEVPFQTSVTIYKIFTFFKTVPLQLELELNAFLKFKNRKC